VVIDMDRPVGSGVFDLSGHVSVVTGGNSGIGLGMAAALAAAGADVAIWGRREALNASAAERVGAAGTKVVPVRCDVTDERSVEDATARTVELLGGLDSCVTSAGVASRPHALAAFPSEEWRRVLAVHLNGTFHVMRAVTRVLVEQGRGGSLIAVSSVSAIHGYPRAAPYGTAKAGLTGLVRSMAVELARYGIRANAVLPGWIDTEMIAGVTGSAKARDAIMPRIPLRRWGTPDDLGGIAVYLASRASRYHTGDLIRVDGGYAIY
jgi:NAD(P)-dependent dehydrogenase (short-subunit alcohol dehydrogenase family)